MARPHGKVRLSPEGKDPCLSPGGAADLVGRTLGVIDGRWKLAVIFRLFRTPVLRFSELERQIEGVSEKMLAQTLRELERDGVLDRTVHPEVPPRVEYALTGAGQALQPALRALRDWGMARLPGVAPDAVPVSPLTPAVRSA